MASNYTMAKRNLKWYQEDTEEALPSRLSEAYEPSRLKAGTDGKNAECVTDGYASKSDREFDDLGAGKGKKTGKVATSESKKAVKKVIKEEFEDDLDIEVEDEFDTGMDVDGMGDDMGGIEGDESVIEDITITVGGQEYRLEPVAGIEDDMITEDPLGDDMEMGAEQDDVTQPVMESRKKALANKALNKALESRAQKLLKQKQLIEQKLAELFTGSYVASTSGDKPTRAGDPNFAVTAKANTGKTYTPTKNTPNAFEPDLNDVATKSKSPDNQVVKTTESKKAEFRKWLQEQEALLEAEDDGQVSVDFNRNDTQDNFIGDEFADMPLEVSGNDNQVGNYGESTKKPVSKGVKALNEALDFKKLMKGEY